MILSGSNGRRTAKPGSDGRMASGKARAAGLLSTNRAPGRELAASVTPAAKYIRIF